MTCLIAVVNRKQCKRLKNALETLQIINKKRSFIQIGEDSIGVPLIETAKQLLIPNHVLDNIFVVKGISIFLKEENCCYNTLEHARAPGVRMKVQIIKLMKARNLWEEHLSSDIPKSWEKYGDLILFDAARSFSSHVWKEVGPELWQCVGTALGVERIALKSRIQSDNFRSPSVQLVWGNGTWVDYVDNGIKYSWDLTRSMFSAGNAPERHRISSLKCDGEIVVDLYAGIGYFTLPYLFYTGVKLIHALEWSPHAIEALKINLKQNKVHEKCIIHEGDSLKLCPKGIADRVNLGLLPKSEAGWKVACSALKSSSGGMLHIHQNVVSHVRKGEISPSAVGTGFHRSAEEKWSSCQQCNHVILQIIKNCSEDFFSNFSNFSFCLENILMLPKCVPEIQIKWKNFEWKVWALHVCHSLCSLFLDIYGTVVTWKVQVMHLHHVKSYAPHIDHLVLDVLCTPTSIDNRIDSQ